MSNEEVKPEVEFLDLKIKKKYIVTPEKRKQYQDTYKAKHPKPVKEIVEKKPFNQKEYFREYRIKNIDRYREHARKYQKRAHAAAKELAELKKVLVPYVMA